MKMISASTAIQSTWHIAAKLSHETNLAITKLYLSLIHNTIGLGLPMFINAITRQQISIYSTGPYVIFACLYQPHFGKVGVQKKFRSLPSRILFCTLLEIRGAAPWVTVNVSKLQHPHSTTFSVWSGSCIWILVPCHRSSIYFLFFSNMRHALADVKCFLACSHQPVVTLWSRGSVRPLDQLSHQPIVTLWSRGSIRPLDQLSHQPVVTSWVSSTTGSVVQLHFLHEHRFYIKICLSVCNDLNIEAIARALSFFTSSHTMYDHSTLGGGTENAGVENAGVEISAR